jgi:hypothetical protein
MKTLVVALSFCLPNLVFASTQITQCRTYEPNVLYVVSWDPQLSTVPTVVRSNTDGTTSIMLDEVTVAETKLKVDDHCYWVRSAAGDFLSFGFSCTVPNSNQVLEGGIQVGAKDQYFIVEGKTLDAFANCERIK